MAADEADIRELSAEFSARAQDLMDEVRRRARPRFSLLRGDDKRLTALSPRASSPPPRSFFALS